MPTYMKSLEREFVMSKFQVINVIRENNNHVLVTGNTQLAVASCFVMGVDTPHVFDLLVYRDYKGLFTAKVKGTPVGSGSTLEASVKMALDFLPILYR
jgi:hypothetical protein